MASHASKRAGLPNAPPAKDVLGQMNAKKHALNESPTEQNDSSKRRRVQVPTPAPVPKGMQYATPYPVSTPRVPSWNVAGHYKVMDRQNIVDTSVGYELTIFHNASSRPRRLYARFTLGHLVGVMRFCPHPTVAPNPNDQHCFYLKDFEEACNLKGGEEPGPVDSIHCRHKWLMRWRARETGMGLGKRVGGEHDVNMGIDFVANPDQSFANRLFWVMLYNGTYFQFDAYKQRDLSPADFYNQNLDPDTHWAKFWLEWCAMFDPLWLQPRNLAEEKAPQEAPQTAQKNRSMSDEGTERKSTIQERPQPVGIQKEAQQSTSLQASSSRPEKLYVYKPRVPADASFTADSQALKQQRRHVAVALGNGPSVQPSTQARAQQAMSIQSQPHQPVQQPPKLQSKPQPVVPRQLMQKPLNLPQTTPKSYEAIAPKALQTTAPKPWPAAAQQSQQEVPRTNSQARDPRPTQRKSTMIDMTGDSEDSDHEPLQSLKSQNQYQSPYRMPSSQTPISPRNKTTSISKQTTVTEVHSRPESQPTLVSVPGPIPGTSYWKIRSPNSSHHHSPSHIEISSGSEEDIPARRETVPKRNAVGESSKSRENASASQKMTFRKNTMEGSSTSDAEFFTPPLPESQKPRSPSPSTQLQAELATPQQGGVDMSSFLGSMSSFVRNSEAQATSEIISPASSSKRGRGRPKGSVKTPRVGVASATSKSRATPITLPTPVPVVPGVKRGPGRPRKSMEMPAKLKELKKKDDAESELMPGKLKEVKKKNDAESELKSPQSRYRPGGPGGGGKRVFEDGTEVPLGGTGPGGYNYFGDRGRIVPQNQEAREGEGEKVVSKTQEMQEGEGEKVVSKTQEMQGEKVVSKTQEMQGGEGEKVVSKTQEMQEGEDNDGGDIDIDAEMEKF